MRAPAIRSFDETWGAIADAVAARRPFSLARFGDGEGMFLGLGEPEPPHRALIMRVWFGDQAVPEGDVDRLVARTREAFLGADLLGMHETVHRGTTFAYAMEAARHHGLLATPERIVSANAHIRLYEAGRLSQLLKGRDFVGLVCGRDVAGTLRQRYGVGRIDQYLVPPEAKFAFCNAHQRHYPDRYRELERLIEVPYQGALFFVGAGLLGKVYGHWIRERGGIAIDVGSVFDAWYGIGTRGFIDRGAKTDVARYSSDHALLLANVYHLGPPETYHAVLDHLRAHAYEDLALLTAFAGTCAHPHNAALRTRLAQLCRKRNAPVRALEEVMRAQAIDPAFAPAREVMEAIKAETVMRTASAPLRWLRGLGQRSAAG